eukprot:6189256-Pleurochrysis_carterae.AAC.3
MKSTWCAPSSSDTVPPQRAMQLVNGGNERARASVSVPALGCVRACVRARASCMRAGCACSHL